MKFRKILKIWKNVAMQRSLVFTLAMIFLDWNMHELHSNEIK